MSFNQQLEMCRANLLLQKAINKVSEGLFLITGLSVHEWIMCYMNYSFYRVHGLVPNMTQGKKKRVLEKQNKYMILPVFNMNYA